MKVNIELEMSPLEARQFLGLPDVSGMQEMIVAEMQKRVMAAMDSRDPEALLKAWMPMGAQGFEQFQRFLWDSAMNAAGAGKRSSGKQTD